MSQNCWDFKYISFTYQIRKQLLLESKCSSLHRRNSLRKTCLDIACRLRYNKQRYESDMLTHLNPVSHFYTYMGWSVFCNSDKGAASIFENLAFQVLIRDKVLPSKSPLLRQSLPMQLYIELIRSCQKKKHY